MEWSAAKKAEIVKNLKSLEIEPFFDIVVSGQDDLQDYTDPEGTNKPKPYIYLHTAKILGVSPQQCVVIEDSDSGVCAGVEAGCFTIAVPNEFTERQDLSKADLRIESFENVEVYQFLQMMENSKTPQKVL